jgi:hypothetical protein
VNSAKFQTFILCQILSLLSVENKVFWVEILYIGSVHHYLRLECFPDPFDVLKSHFQISEKEGIHVV